MSLFSELKKPFNIVTLLLTVFSITVSFIFYFKSQKVKGITFVLNEPASLIYDSKISVASIKLYEKDTIPIIGNVYLLTGTIWNSGDLPITQNDIRLPITIKLLNSSKILDYKITQQLDSSIAGFIFSRINLNSLQVDWKYFDPGFGFSFQIIYIGDIESKFNLTGKILDISNFKKANKSDKKNIYSLLAILFNIPNLILAILIYYKATKRKLNFARWFSVIVMILSLIGFFYFLWKYLFYPDGTPPL